MKLRLRENSLRLRVNRKEVDALAAGQFLSEQVNFPGGETLSYVLEPGAALQPAAVFDGKLMRITTPQMETNTWAASDEIGLYFQFNSGLKIAIEKDLECVDGPPEENDPWAFPRDAKSC